MKVLIIVDFNNLFYRAYYSQKEMHILYPWLPVIKYFDMLRKCSQHVINRYQLETPLEFIFAGESRTKLERTKISSSYKNNRKPMKDDIFLFSKKGILKIIRNSGFEIETSDGIEADDVIASIVKTTKDKQIIIFSNDRDMRQLLVYPNVTIYMNPGMFYSCDNFQKEYGILPEHFTIYKALLGDKTDNVNGILGWGPVKIKKHILSGNWKEMVIKEGKEIEFNEALSLVKLYFSELSINSHPFKISNLENLKLKLEKIYSPKGVDDIILTLKRFEEVLNAKSI